MEKVLITGANGFLATNTIHGFLDGGYAVKGVLRSPEKYVGRRDPALELCKGDFSDTGFIEDAMKGCDYVVHIAAMTSQEGPYREFYRLNVEAVEGIMQAAIRNNIRKVVCVSSANTIGYGDINDPGDETRPPRSPISESKYASTKQLGQQKALSYKDVIDVTVVNPTFMIGPFDSKPSSGRSIMMGYGKPVVFFPPGGKNFLNVKDAAAGIVAALKKGRNGEIYLLGGENLSFREFYTILNDVSGRNPVMIELPAWILLPAGAICSLLSKIGIRTDATLNNMKILCIEDFYTNRKSVEELGIKYHGIPDAIRDAVEWFRSRGML